jgi:hypothetical protein
MATVADGTYIVVPASATGCAMDVEYALDENDVTLRIFTRSTASDASKDPAQIVQVITVAPGVQIIRFPLTGKVMDLTASPAAGGSVVQYAESGSDLQRWVIADTGAKASLVGNYTTATSSFELYTIESHANTGFAVKAGTASWDALTLAATNTTASAQRWAFLPLYTITDGTYFICCVNDPSVVCDVAYKSTANGARVFIDALNGGNNQIWNISNNSDGTASITDTNSGKLLSCGLSGTSGTEAYIWQNENHDDQHWVIVAESGMSYNNQVYPIYEIKAKVGTTLSLDYQGGSTQIENKLQVYTANGTNAQRFIFIPTEAYGASMPVPSSFMMRFPDGRYQARMWGNCPPTYGITDGVENSNGSWTTHFRPSLVCTTKTLQMRWRSKSLLASNHSSGSWGPWRSIADNSTANSGWGKIWQANVTMTKSGSRLVSPYGIDVTVGTGSGQSDEVVIELQARSYTDSYGDSAASAHGPTYDGTCTVVWAAAPTFSAAAMSSDGIWIPYTSTLPSNESNATLKVSASEASGNVVFRSYTNTAMNASDTFKVPHSKLSRVPADGTTLNLTWTLTSSHGVARSGTSSVTISSDTDHGITVAPTFVYDSYLRGYRCTFKAGTTNACYVYVTSGHSQRYETCEQIGSDATAGTVTYLVLPQLNKSTTVLTTAYTSDTKWGFNSDTVAAISSEDAVWNWSIGSNIVSAALRVSTDNSPSHTYDLTPDYSVHVTTGREHEVVTFGETMTGELESTGVIVPSLLDEIPNQIETNFDALAYTGSRGEDVIFRDPFGRWARVAIIGVSQPHQLSIYSALTVKMREVTP